MLCATESLRNELCALNLIIIKASAKLIGIEGFLLHIKFVTQFIFSGLKVKVATEHKKLMLEYIRVNLTYLLIKLEPWIRFKADQA